MRRLLLNDVMEQVQTSQRATSMNCVWACTKGMDYPPKRVRGRSGAARLGKLIPGNAEHVSGTSLPKPSVAASPSHSVTRAQDFHDPVTEVSLCGTGDESEVTSLFTHGLVEAGVKSSVSDTTSKQSVTDDLEIRLPLWKTKSWKVKACLKLEEKDDVKKVRIYDADLKQDLSVVGNTVGKGNLQNEHDISLKSQGLHMKPASDQHKGNNNVILSIKLDEKNADSADDQHKENDSRISSVKVVGEFRDITSGIHHESDKLSEIDKRITDSTGEQHNESDNVIYSKKLDGQNADSTSGHCPVTSSLKKQEAICTLYCETNHIISEGAELLDKSLMFIKKEISEESIGNSDIVKEGVTKYKSDDKMLLMEHTKDSIITEKNKTQEKIENEDPEASGLLLQIREPVCVRDKGMRSRNVEDHEEASPSDSDSKNNVPEDQKMYKPSIQECHNLRLESEVGDPCNDAESNSKERRLAEKEYPLQAENLTNVTYPLVISTETKGFDLQPDSCRLAVGKDSFTGPSHSLIASICKKSYEQDSTAIDTDFSSSEAQIHSEKGQDILMIEQSVETQRTTFASTSGAVHQKQNADLYDKMEETQDRQTCFVNQQRTVQTLPEKEREKSIEVGSHTGILTSECHSPGTQGEYEEDSSHHIVLGGDVFLHGKGSDNKQISRNVHNSLKLLTHNSVSVAEGGLCREETEEVLLDELNQPVENMKCMVRNKICNQGKETDTKEAILDVLETIHEKDDVDMKNLSAGIKQLDDYHQQDLLKNSDEERIGRSSDEEGHAQKEEHYPRVLDHNKDGTSMKGFEFEGFVKVQKLESELTEAVKDKLRSRSVHCLVQKEHYEGAPESNGVKENTSSSLSQTDIISVSCWNEQVKMTSLLTISGALGCKKQLLIVPRSYLTVELVMAALSLRKFSYEDIYAWICKICKPTNRDFTEINRQQFMQYELLHRIISKNCDAYKRKQWEEVLKKTLYVLPKHEGWSLIFEKIPDICQHIVTCNPGFSNNTKKKSVASSKKCKYDKTEEKLGVLIKKLNVKRTQIQVLRGKQVSVKRKLKSIKEKLQEKINGIKVFLKIHGGKNLETCLKPSNYKSHKTEINFFSETEEVLLNLYELVQEKEAENSELHQKVTDLKDAIEERDKVIQHKNELVLRCKSKAGLPMESRSEKKQKDQDSLINHLQEKLRNTKELVNYKESHNSRLREELRTQQQFLGEKDRTIAQNEEKIADLKSETMSCRSFHGQLEHKLHIAHCSLRERDVYIRSLEDQYYGVSQDLRLANFSLQEKISVIHQQQNLLDQQKEKQYWTSKNDIQKRQDKQTEDESVTHYMEEYYKHLADLENRLIQCNNILGEKEKFIKQLQKNFSDYQAFVKEKESRTSQLAVGRTCRKCLEPVSKLDSEIPSSSDISFSTGKYPMEGEGLARRDEKLRNACKRVQDLQREVEYLVERAKPGTPTCDLKEMLEMKRKNATLQQCIITREEMNAQLEEKLSVQNKEIAYFKQQLQTKSTIIEYLQNFLVDKETIPLKTESDGVGISNSIKAQNQSSGYCEKNKDRIYHTSDPFQSATGVKSMMKRSISQVEVQSSDSSHRNVMDSLQTETCSKVQQGMLNTLQERRATDKEIGIYQHKTNTEKEGNASIASLYENVPKVEAGSTIQENNNYKHKEDMNSQKTSSIWFFTNYENYNKGETSKMLQLEKNVEDQTIKDFNSEERTNLKFGVEDNCKQEFMNLEPKKGLSDQAEPRLQLPKQGTGLKTADADRKRVFEGKESKIMEKTYPVKITYSEYCQRNKNKIFPHSTSTNNGTATGQGKLHSNEKLSQESGWHDNLYSIITRERKCHNLVAGHGEMGRKRNLSTEIMLDIEQMRTMESKRCKYDVEKKAKMMQIKTNAEKKALRIPNNCKTNKGKISGNKLGKQSKDPLEEIKKLKKIIEDLKYRNDKEMKGRAKVEAVSRKREIVMAQILDHNEKLKRQVKEGDVALTLIERERVRVNQLLLENEVSLVEAAKTREKLSRNMEDKDKALQNYQKELDNLKMDLKRKEELHEKEIESYGNSVSDMEKEVDKLKLCIAEKDEIYEKDLVAANERIAEKVKALEDLHCERSCLFVKIKNMGEGLQSVKEEVMELLNSLIEEKIEIAVNQVGKRQVNEEKVGSHREMETTEEGKGPCEEKLSAGELSLEKAIVSLDCIMQDIKVQLASLGEELSSHQKANGYRCQLIKDMLGEKESLQNALKLQQEELKEIVTEHGNCKMEIGILRESFATEVEQSKKLLEEGKTKIQQMEEEAETLTKAKKILEAEQETNKHNYTLLIEKEGYWKHQLSNAQNCIEELSAAKSFLAQQLQAIDMSREQLRKELGFGIPKQKVWNLDQELMKVRDMRRQLDEEKKMSLGVSRHLLEEKKKNKNLLLKIERKKIGKNSSNLDQPSHINSESQTTSSLEEEMHTILENYRNIQLTLEAERQVSEDFYKELLLEKRKNTFLNDCFKHECMESSKDMEHQLSFFSWMADKYRARMQRMDELSSTIQEFTENLEDQ
ncbi:golgin subfamily A member 4-like [Penaeus japonicus]|uniref:golgin subfamily A member 4-like n=1 Tax=Penaeus japonicus TaxID=27405 RepID=UPI001C70E8BB|nr:golgin subfamily A member 4-like [Penaeus japonicus]